MKGINFTRKACDVQGEFGLKGEGAGDRSRLRRQRIFNAVRFGHVFAVLWQFSSLNALQQRPPQSIDENGITGKRFTGNCDL